MDDFFRFSKKNRVLGYSLSTLLWHRCYYPHRSRDALSPGCGIFSQRTHKLSNYAGVARELSETFSLAAAGRAQVQTIDGTPLAPEELTDTRAEFNFGAAYRPRGEGFVVLNRFDVKYDDLADGSKTVKLVNNLALNAMLGDRTQLTGYFGLKNVEATLGDQSYKSTSGLFGGEARFDISETIDLGFHGQMITTGNTHSYAYGPSIGWAPVQNTWISLGYNLDGYTDDDFQAAEYSQQGAYLKLRLKFDQDSAHWLLSKISPR